MRAFTSYRPAIRPLLIGQIGFVVGLLVCFALKPQFLHSEGGFSNYGVTHVTIPVYTFAFLSAAIGAFWTAQSSVKTRPLFAWALRVLAVLFLAVMTSTYPYKLNNFYDTLHQDMAIAIFAWESILGTWFIAKYHDRLNILFYTIQIAASVAALVTLLGFVHLLFVSQFFTGIAFAALLVHASDQLLQGHS